MFKHFGAIQACHRLLHRLMESVVQALYLSMFSHIASMPDETCQEDLNSFPLENWRRPPGRPHTIQQELKSN